MSQQPKLVIFAGPNGSGKTTLYYKWRVLGRFKEFVYINTDELAAELGSDIAGGREALSRRTDLLATKTSFITETTLAGNSAPRLIKEAVRAGFTTTLIYVCTSDPATNIKRVAERVRQGGHHVPTHAIVRRYHDSLKNLSGAIKDSTFSHVFDSDGRTTRVLSSYKNGFSLRSCRKTPNWIRSAIN